MSAAGVTFEVTHRTEYRYDDPVVAGYSVAHLVPRSFPGQSCVRSEVLVDPMPGGLSERRDYFGNRATWFEVHDPHHHLRVVARSLVERLVPEPGFFPGGVTDPSPWADAVTRLATDPDPEGLLARELALSSPLVPRLAGLEAYARESFPAGRPLLDAALDLSSRIHQDFAYVPGATETGTRLEEVLRDRRGVCQDFAHLAIGCLRSLGVPARYVSGYLETEAAPGHEKLVGADASHAWFSVFVPGAGWIDLDPTNDQVPDERYVTTAWGRDYSDVAPLKGVVFSAASSHELSVAVDVVRVEGGRARA